MDSKRDCNPVRKIGANVYTKWLDFGAALLRCAPAGVARPWCMGGVGWCRDQSPGLQLALGMNIADLHGLRPAADCAACYRIHIKSASRAKRDCNDGD